MSESPELRKAFSHTSKIESSTITILAALPVPLQSYHPASQFRGQEDIKTLLFMIDTLAQGDEIKYSELCAKVVEAAKRGHSVSAVLKREYYNTPFPKPVAPDTDFCKHIGNAFELKKAVQQFRNCLADYTPESLRQEISYYRWYEAGEVAAIISVREDSPFGFRGTELLGKENMPLDDDLELKIIKHFEKHGIYKMASMEGLLRELGYLGVVLAPFWGNLTADMVKTSTCKEYGKSRGGAGSTIRRELGVLQAAINFSHREGVLTQLVSVTLPPRGKPKERYLTRSELASLLLQSPKHLQQFILISIYTGRRKEAVLGLNWKPNNKSGWVDLKAGMIHFLGVGEIETTKRKGSIRIPPKLLSHLKSWHDPDAASVITYNGRSIKDVKKAFALACEKAGIEGATPHTLKHTAVTLGFQSGLTMEEATDYFATTAETLARVYRQHSPHKNQAAMGPMQRLGK